MTEQHHDYEFDLASFALRALDEGRMRELRLHLAECARCRAYLAWLEPAVDALSGSVESQPPPHQLRERVMRVVRDEAESAQAKRQPDQGFGAERERAARRWLRPAAALATVAAATALVTGLLVADADPPATTTTSLEASVPRLERTEGTLVREGDSATVHIRGLPRLRGGDVYQAWLRYDDVVKPSTVFTVDQNGNGVAAVPVGVNSADELMITREPRGGSSRPSTEPLVRGAVD